MSDGDAGPPGRGHARDSRRVRSVAERILRRRGKQEGAPPGTVVHTGHARTHDVRLHWLEYGPDFCREHESESLDRAVRGEPPPPVTWLDVDGVHDLSVVERIGAGAALHPLVQEDIASVGQRAKVEEYGDTLFIVVRMLTVDEATREIEDEQVSMILSSGLLISFQEGTGDVFDHVRRRIREGKGSMRNRGADYLAYTLIDAVVDGYFETLERLGELTDELEQEVVSVAPRDSVRRIHHIKREMLVMRRAVWPLRDMLNSLVRDEAGCISPETRVFLRDAYDHTIQVMDTIETLRDVVSGLMDIYLSSVSNRMNEVMKVLTVIATVFIPLTFLVGVYGMNFDWMPELRWRWSYPVLWVLMIAIAAGMLSFFRTRRWL